MKIKYSILIGLLVLLLFSCEKPDPNGCHNSVIFYNYLTAAARNQTPYFTNPSFDTLSFASDKGDTVIFVKTKTDSTWYKEEIRGNPACDWDKNYYQVLQNSYAVIKGSGSFDVKHYLKKNSYYSNYIEINFNSFHFNLYDDWIGLTRYPTYKEIVSINNRDYYSSIKLSSVNADTTQNYTLINKTYGLFFINDKVTNTNFVLIK
jgi:hypothetical protein